MLTALRRQPDTSFAKDGKHDVKQRTRSLGAGAFSDMLTEDLGGGAPHHEDVTLLESGHVQKLVKDAPDLGLYLLDD